MSKNDPGYNSSPTLGDKIHCLVSVLPADESFMVDKRIFDKMGAIREHASDLGKINCIV